jgi:hypothetical protein
VWGVGAHMGEKSTSKGEGRVWRRSSNDFDDVAIESDIRHSKTKSKQRGTTPRHPNNFVDYIFLYLSCKIRKCCGGLSAKNEAENLQII